MKTFHNISKTFSENDYFLESSCPIFTAHFRSQKQWSYFMSMQHAKTLGSQGGWKKLKQRRTLPREKPQCLSIQVSSPVYMISIIAIQHNLGVSKFWKKHEHNYFVIYTGFLSKCCQKFKLGEMFSDMIKDLIVFIDWVNVII